MEKTFKPKSDQILVLTQQNIKSKVQVRKINKNKMVIQIGQ